ncbi:hypothetical protein [Anaerocolumna sp. MB42-C2]|uniref:hypothetical protein n=1 Tax=Anaerocolumna sp. MB42-C2 TaxID=3070997 RepID=UPI0027E0C264|nr:hypothetical protein [Anaerocolumna sp. MB42-C2]WMJ85941.1 hypothetical protein RBU59_18055 [Anaerocolumna sp. MB42-C2]
MIIRIIKGSSDYSDDCEEALVNSELGKRLFVKVQLMSSVNQDFMLLFKEGVINSVG